MQALCLQHKLGQNYMAGLANETVQLLVGTVQAVSVHRGRVLKVLQKHLFVQDRLVVKLVPAISQARCLLHGAHNHNFSILGRLLGFHLNNWLHCVGQCTLLCTLQCRPATATQTLKLTNGTYEDCHFYTSIATASLD